MDNRDAPNRSEINDGQLADEGNETSQKTNVRSRIDLEQSEEISLKELFVKLQSWAKYLLSKWYLIVALGVAGGILGFLYALTKKEKFIAEVTFIMEGQKPSAGMYGGLASQLGLVGGASSGSDVFSGNNFYSLMRSRSMMQRLLLTEVEVDREKMTLAEYYIKVKKFRETWAEESPALVNVHFPLNSDPSKFTIVQNSLISSFHAGILAEELFIGLKDKKETIMVIRVTSDDELFSKTFAELVATEISEFYVSTKTTKTKRDLARLRHQADSVRKEFNEAIRGVSSSLDANPNPNLSRVRLAVPSKQREVDAQVNQTMLMELIKNIEMTKMTLNEETPLIQVIDRPVLPLPVSRPKRAMFMLLGAVAFGFASVVYLIIRKILREL